MPSPRTLHKRISMLFPSPTFNHMAPAFALVGSKLMESQLIHKRPAGRSSGIPSPKGKTRELAPSQSYWFVHKFSIHDLFARRRRQYFSLNFFFLPHSGGARNLRVEHNQPTGTSGKINFALEPALLSSFGSDDLWKCPGLISNSCKSPAA